MYRFDADDFLRVPGLYRLWDLQLVINATDEFQVHYAEMSEDGTPLFALYRRGKSAQSEEVS